MAAQQERLQSAEKTRTRLAAELARTEGRELWRDPPPQPSGRRVASRTVPAFTDEVRALALSFVAGQASCFIAIAEDPPGILLATSADSGIHAGNVLKAALAKHGGRGGGNAVLAQGSGAKEALEKVRAEVQGQME